eukprot:CAMPEP_0194198852 /NCGR_PEP_ID=MMETSP0156-20130528/78_1 /TAXON_ID=33649 /ORGANISM="Thalassionema nitzschioides, Strain L26-B" /LENGTH=886 /DNA_ID=CAMNT_0038923681 /DNA_START=23 /DNA_END=2679 /DNA_ORIENTATION=-
MILFLLSIAVLSSATVAADKLDDVLTSSSGIFATDSVKCPGGAATSFQSVFSSTDDISDWDPVNLGYEENAFEIDMTHMDPLVQRDWTLRIGNGGQIMSLIVDAGESIANQGVAKSIWNDLVQQMVAVNTDLNGVNNYPNFIHGSGTYSLESEGTKPPFYNPKLAVNCEGNDCTIINWGQQAHVPTPWDSPIMYYTRYRDCGNGVIQYDMAMYHFGRTGATQTDFKYFNTPWTGVRTSTFPHVMVSATDGQLNDIGYLYGWGNSKNIIHNLDTTGGFTTFAEKLPIPQFEMPFCVDSLATTNWYYCTATNAAIQGALVPFTFQVQSNTVATTGHASTYGVAKTVRMQWCNLSTNMPDGSWGWGFPTRTVTITNDDTGYSFESDYIIHYCWAGYTYMSVPASLSNSDISNNFPVLNAETGNPTSISVVYTDTAGVAWTDQSGLTFVHGKGVEYKQDWHRGKSRVRYGTTNAKRDGTIFTTNLLGTLSEGEIYYGRKFMVTDLLSNMQSKGIELNPEAFEEVFTAGARGTGEVIKLWSGGTSFGASIGSEACPEATLVCQGNSAPSDTTRPLFYITCGMNLITTHDPYTDPYTGVAPTDYIKKPYKCQLNEVETGRGIWKLLGFFADGACSGIGSLEYSSDFCELQSSTPSSFPSKIHSLSPSETASDSPSVQASAVPSEIASDTPSVQASSVPSVQASSVPSVQASAVPSETTSDSPSVKGSLVPSETTSDPPSIQASLAPSEIASDPPSIQASMAPSEIASDPPSIQASMVPSETSVVDQTLAAIVCGGNDGCRNDAEMVDPTESHEVRCCSDTAKDGWVKKSNCDVWGGSRVPTCFHGEDLATAEAICQAEGARLCTAEELYNKCAKGSGCGHDSDLIWSSFSVT